MKKEVVKVPFDGVRFKEYLEIAGITVKNVAEIVGCSGSTIRRAVKNGEINEQYLPAIAEFLVVDEGYLKGEKDEKYVRLAKAVTKANKALAELNAALVAE